MEITVFTTGDANLLSTWSNVPYFFTKTLEKKGVKVNRVNIRPNRFFKTLYRVTAWQILKRMRNHDAYEYYRTSFHRWLTNRSIQSAVKKYSNSDCFLSLNFSFSAKPFTNKPVFLFGDWTFEHYFTYFKDRPAGALEQAFINAENELINHADAVFVLFPKVAAYMHQRYPEARVFYLGNVINSVYESSEISVLQQKLKSKKLLFVGSKKYIDGARQLVEAFQVLKSKYADLEAHFIGIEKNDIGNTPDGIFCYGYLNKEIDAERNLYYNLLEQSRVFVNTTPKWSAFSASLESMYFYNPQIITQYDEFTETFPQYADFTLFNSSGTVEELCLHIESMLSDDHYVNKCKAAHEAALPHTWDSFISKFLDKVKEIVG